MSALRKPLNRPRFWITLIAAAALAAAAIFDWTRPPAEQWSARLYGQALVRPYQRFVSPRTSHFIHCRYQPTCSYYSLLAVQTHGLPKGLWLTTKRIFRCTPWVPMGTVDPVPPRRPVAAISVPKK